MSGSDSPVTRALLLSGVAAAAAVAYVPPLTRLATTGPSWCALFRTTGLLCPGCGMTRAAVALLHGHPVAAFTFNPLVYVVVAFLCWSLWPAGAGRPGRRARPGGGGGPLAFGVLGASLVLAVARNVL